MASLNRHHAVHEKLSGLERGYEMALSSDYFERIHDGADSAERAYNDGDMEEAAEYMQEVADIAAEFLEELERHYEEGELESPLEES
jgi:hypothetical protein